MKKMGGDDKTGIRVVKVFLKDDMVEECNKVEKKDLREADCYCYFCSFWLSWSPRGEPLYWLG